MEDKQITALTERAYANMVGTDCTALETADGTTYKAELADIKQYCNENKTIGGTTAGDIVTIDGTQTFTNKRADALKLNEDVALTATSTELNKLDACTAATADLNLLAGLAAAGLSGTELGYVNGVTSGIQSQINSILAIIPSVTEQVYTYVKEWTETGTDEAITEATINTACSIPSGYYVNHQSVVPALYSISGGTYTLVVDPAITMTRTNVGGGVYGLDTLTVASLTSGDYCLALSFQVVASA